MAEQERHLLYKIKPALAGDSVADATDVELSSTFTGLMVGATDPDDAIKRFDATGIGADIFEFTGSYNAQNSNIDEWFNDRSGVHVQGADGQSNATRNFNLPGLTALGTIFDRLVALNLPETYTILVSYFGGTSSSSLSNRLNVVPITNVDNAPGGFGFRNNVVLNRGDSVTLQITRRQGVISSWSMISRGTLTTTSGGTLNDIQLQTRTWANLDGTFLPGSDDVLKGYAFRVVASPENDGKLRQGLIDAAIPSNSLDDRVIYDGDWVVWEGDTFTSWLNSGDWFVLPADHVFRLTQEANNFLQHVNEDDTPVNTRLKETGIGGDALIWLTDTDGANGGILTQAPFLNPLTSNPPDPRNSGPTPLYVGGRELQTSTDDFSQGSNDFQALLYIVINSQMVSAFGLSNIYLQVIELDGSVRQEINVNDMFVKPSFNDNSTGQYFVYSQYKINDSLSQFRYVANERLRLIARTQDRHFTFDAEFVNTTSAVSDLQESQLSQEAQAKLNRETSFTPVDRARLNAIESTNTQQPLPSDFPLRIKFGAPSHLQSDYREWDNDNGLLQDFTNTSTYTVYVPSTAQLTGTVFTGTGTITLTEITPSLFDDTRTYTITIPPAPDNINYDPLDHPVSFTGTMDINVPDGLSPSIKVDADNFDQAFLDSILNDDQSIPASLGALSNQAEVFHFDNVDFVSNNAHAGVGAMFSFLKLRPDERLGDPVPTNTTLFKEITNSEITATIDNIVGLFYPRTIGGQFDDGVSVTTQGALTGAGAVQEPVNIMTGTDSNYRLVIGFWFDTTTDNVITTVRNFLRVKERGQSSFRRLFGIEGLTRIGDSGLVEEGAVLTERIQGSAGTSAQVPVTHHLYTTNGELIHTFTGIGAAETLFRVNEARTYTFSATLSANGNNEGTDTFDVTIANINQDQNLGQHTLNFTASGHPHSQVVNVEYVASSSTYGGPGHTLRFELNGGLTDNGNFDIDHLAVTCGYVTTETVTTPASYAEANAGGDHLFKPNKRNRIIMSFRKAANNDNLQCNYVLSTFDSNDQPLIEQSNTVDFGYPVYDLDWSEIKLGNTNQMVIQNIQGFLLNTDTPLNEFPTHANMVEWLAHHDDKATDYVWDNASAPDRNIEAVHFPENVNFSNFILEDTENTDRYHITIVNGVLTPVKLT